MEKIGLKLSYASPARLIPSQRGATLLLHDNDSACRRKGAQRRTRMAQNIHRCGFQSLQDRGIRRLVPIWGLLANYPIYLLSLRLFYLIRIIVMHDLMSIAFRSKLAGIYVTM